jgi:hypothetical protein
MRQKAQSLRAMGWLGVALILAGALCLISAPIASAQDFNPKDYFQFIYEPVTFDKNEIHGSDVFHATIAGRATCTKDLPVKASEASLTSQVIAEHAASGTRLTLNSSYTITIKPFPSKEGETADVNQSVPLQFPTQAESGDYNVIGKIVEAKVNVSIIPIPVTSYLPQEQQMGTVKYIAPEPTATTDKPPVPENPPATEPEPGPAPLKSIPSGDDIPVPQEEPEPIPWWFEVIILIAIAAIIFNIVWFLRHRHR